MTKYGELKAHWYCLKCNPFEACRLLCPLESGEPRYCPIDRRLAKWKLLFPKEDWPTDFTEHSIWVCEKCSYYLPCKAILLTSRGRPKCCPGTRDPVTWDVDTKSDQVKLPVPYSSDTKPRGGSGPRLA